MSFSGSNGDFPAAYWELAELVLAGCPDAALKAFRNTVIRGKPLTARGADSAIRGAKLYACGDDKLSNAAYSLMDTAKDRLSRAELYFEMDLPIIMARLAGEEWPAEVVRFVTSVPDIQGVSYLEFDAEHVDRLMG